MGAWKPQSQPAYDWEQLYAELSPVLYQYGCKVTSDQSLIEDCIHDVFVSFYRTVRTSTVQHPKAYLLKSFRHMLIGRLKTDVRHLEIIHREYLPHFELEFSSEDQWVSREADEEQRRALSEALQKLSPRQREAVYLKFYENHSYEEVAEVMKVEKSALYTLIYKSLQQMKRVLHAQKALRVSIGLPALAMFGFFFL